MASQVSTSEIFKSLGARIADAHAASKDVQVAAVGGVGLPPGINNGVAKLAVLEFIEGKKEDDKGKYYFRAAGVMRIPEHHDGIKVAGRHTSQLIPFFDTPKRQNKKTFLPDKDGKGHYVDFRDLFAHLGVTPPPPMQPGESKEAFGQRVTTYYAGAMQILLDPTKPPVYFGVRTWAPDKKPGEREPGTFEFWNERVEYVERGAAANPAAGVSMAPPAMSPSGSNGQMVMNPQQPFVEPPQAVLTPPPTQPSVPAFVATGADDAQVTAWGEAADMDSDPPETDDGKEAVRQLSAVCVQVGLTNADLGTQKNWVGVVGLIMQKRSGGAAPAAATGGSKPDPVKGDVRTYQAQQCEVTSVNAEGRTATLKVVGGKAVVVEGKLVKVPFAELS